jgi:hypothetical protein
MYNAKCRAQFRILASSSASSNNSKSLLRPTLLLSGIISVVKQNIMTEVESYCSHSGAKIESSSIFCSSCERATPLAAAARAAVPSVTRKSISRDRAAIAYFCYCPSCLSARSSLSHIRDVMLTYLNWENNRIWL